MTESVSVILGIVHDLNKQPIIQARVYFISSPTALPEIAALTDNEGKFSLAAPVEGAYQLGVIADGFMPASVTVAVVEGEQEVKLKITLKSN